MGETRRKGWNEGFGTVTRSIDEWRMTDSDIRAFLALTTRWMDERYEQVWNELGKQPGSEDGPELPDLFNRAVDGLEPLDYHWMLQAAVVRDAVSAFEVYLEKTGAEVLQRHGYTWKVQLGRTPGWLDMVDFFSDQLDIELDTDRVKHIRTLRHTLTHLRGELRSPQQRERFGQNCESDFPSYRAELSVETVTTALDDLAEVVRHVDPVAWRFAYGDGRLELG
jgi:hypothetical protein